MRIKNVSDGFGYLEQIMQLQKKLCECGELSDYLVIQENVLKSNFGSPNQVTLVAEENSEVVGFSVIGIKSRGTIDPYDPFLDCKILRVLGIPVPMIYHNLLNASELRVKRDYAVSSCDIRVVDEDHGTEKVCKGVVEERDYRAINSEFSPKIKRPITLYKKELLKNKNN